MNNEEIHHFRTIYFFVANKIDRNFPLWSEKIASTMEQILWIVNKKWTKQNCMTQENSNRLWHDLKNAFT